MALTPSGASRHLPQIGEERPLLGLFGLNRDHAALGDAHLRHGFASERQPPAGALRRLDLQKVAGAEVVDGLHAAQRLALDAHHIQAHQIGDVELVLVLGGGQQFPGM